MTTDDFDKILSDFCENGVSDIYLISGGYIEYKKSGRLTKSDYFIESDSLKALLNEIHSVVAIEQIKSKPISFPYQVLDNKNKLHRFRCEATRIAIAGADFGFELTLRTISTDIKSVAQLGLPSRIVDSVDSKFGIVLVSGPTNSGKSTSLASLIRYICETSARRVITYEDPIEYLHILNTYQFLPKQTQVYTDVPDWRFAIKSSLRRSADVLMFGELRDKESIEASIIAANNGTLFLSTTHANGVSQTLPRLIDEIEVERRHSMTIGLLNSIRCIFHQRLIGCKSGGLIACFSYLVFSSDIRDYIIKRYNGSNLDSLVSEALKKHGVPLDVHARSLFLGGDIELAEYSNIVRDVGSSYEKPTHENDMAFARTKFQVSVDDVNLFMKCIEGNSGKAKGII